MILLKKREKLTDLIKKEKSKGKSIGFVPTMGALHEGHLSLIRSALDENDTVVCSIFINPAQFNNKSDLSKYPVTLEADLDMVEKTGCSVLFLPATEEMYPVNEKAEHYDLGYLETILEGEYRPGHFQGVCRIVDKLLAAVIPDIMYLGKKDYQQCMVIKKMTDLKHADTALRLCDTVREADGLAMSSRNMRLTKEERARASEIYNCLKNIRSDYNIKDITQIKQQAFDYLISRGFKPDYIEIANAATLKPLNDKKEGNAVALIAASLNDVRLIDNMSL